MSFGKLERLNTRSKQTTPQARLVTVTATDGLFLPALWYESPTSTKRAAIWLHGMGSSGSFYPVDHTNALAAALLDHHISFLALNNRGGGMLQGLKFIDPNGERQRRLQGTT